MMALPARTRLRPVICSIISRGFDYRTKNPGGKRVVTGNKIGPVSQSAEDADLKSAKCRFESDRGYQLDKMKILVYNNEYKHIFLMRHPNDPKLGLTRCGIKFFYDPINYERALRVTNQKRPQEDCNICASVSQSVEDSDSKSD